MTHPPDPGRAPDQQETQVSDQHLHMGRDGPAMHSSPPERQAVEVKPMRYVPGVGIALAILAMVLAFILTGGHRGF